MKKSILSNPAFRYIFEVFIIVFSVTVSFYIKNELNERDKMELKNESLKGVLIDLEKDKDFYNAALESIFYRLNSSDRLIEKGIDSGVLNSFLSYWGFVGHDASIKSLIATGAIIGGVVGYYAPVKLGEHNGFQYVVSIDDKTRPVTLIQGAMNKDDKGFEIGQRVTIVYSDKIWIRD